MLYGILVLYNAQKYMTVTCCCHPRKYLLVYYRQVFGATVAVYNNVTEEPWMFLKEISSGGDVSTVCELIAKYTLLKVGTKVFNDSPSEKIELLMCCPLHVLVTRMWQSQVEIEHYSVAYCVTAFEVL